MNENMQGLVLIAHINRLGSLSATAQSLGVSRSSVSKQLAALEKRIGSRLFNRTTRKIMLTEVGRQVLNEAHKVELALKAIDNISEDSRSQVSGTLNVSCASAQGRVHLVPLITRFLACHPKIIVNLQLEDRFVDLVGENIDLSVRVGFLPDSSLIARKLGDLTGVLCASPEYLSNALPLKVPGDLLQHQCLVYKNSEIALDTWTFVGEHGEERVTVSGPLTINDPGALLLAALEGAGVLLSDRGLLGDSMRDGRLVPVLPAYRAIGTLPMYVVYREKELVPARARALIQFLLEHMPAAIQPA